MADQSYESLNRPGAVFNTGLYGPDTTITPLRRLLQPMNDEVQAPAPSERPKVLTQLPGSTAPAVVTVAAPQETELPVYLDGNFSAIRAARVAHQYRVDFWTADSDIIAAVAADDAADPTEAQLDTMYADLALFSYMPAQLFPTRAAFGEQSKPSLRGGVVAASVSSMGLGTGVQPETPAIRTFTGGTEAGPILPVNTPFALRIGTLCMDRFFDMELAQ